MMHQLNAMCSVIHQARPADEGGSRTCVPAVAPLATVIFRLEPECKIVVEPALNTLAIAVVGGLVGLAGVLVGCRLRRRMSGRLGRLVCSQLRRLVCGRLGWVVGGRLGRLVLC